MEFLKSKPTPVFNCIVYTAAMEHFVKGINISCLQCHSVAIKKQVIQTLLVCSLKILLTE